ncbi:polyphenol oxidase family protein [Candidatus Poriferisodalis sp.]|uniref:polyphenol oxidase family protein n=1 Tax=Candidatus Poriferisodalis sp. TaxID=3101277 RepID=UPI003B529C73
MLTLRRRSGASTVRIAVTERSDGDCAPLVELGPSTVTVLKQTHGTHVVRVSHPGEHRGTSADAAWTMTSGATLAVRTADCVPIALYGTDASGRGAVATVHAGWRGLLGGVVETTLAELGRHGIRHIRAVVGPHICRLHYEFGPDELDAAVSSFGPSVASRTAWGTPALDLGEAARRTLRSGGAMIDTELGRCTASDGRYFSHRTRAEKGRTALLVCLDADGAGDESGD